MDKALLLEACVALTVSDMAKSAGGDARPQAVRQFNALLDRAQELYPSRPDVRAMEAYEDPRFVHSRELIDAAQRLLAALELHRPGSMADSVDSIQLPSVVDPSLAADLVELRDAVALGRMALT